MNKMRHILIISADLMIVQQLRSMEPQAPMLRPKPLPPFWANDWRRGRKGRGR